MEFIQFLIAFNLGLFSTLHCLGMCGGIIAALTLGVSPGNENKAATRTSFVIAYNSGRIFSYMVAGGVCGFVGQQLAGVISPAGGHRLLQVVASLVLVLIGLHLAGWLPRLRLIEYLGLRLWQRIQPAGKYFLPVRNPGQALLIGMIWGWLPCALVYSVLLWTVASGSALNGALIMLAFGLGTFPGMVGAGLLGNRLLELLKQEKLRAGAGLIIILFGVMSYFLPVHFHQHEHHDAVDQAPHH